MKHPDYILLRRGFMATISNRSSSGNSPLDICHVIGRKNSEVNCLQDLIQLSRRLKVPGAFATRPSQLPPSWRLSTTRFHCTLSAIAISTTLLIPGSSLFLPTSNFFIDFERADQDRRQETCRTDWLVPYPLALLRLPSYIAVTKSRPAPHNQMHAVGHIGDID